jgi:acyl-CoA thioesterase I
MRSAPSGFLGKHRSGRRWVLRGAAAALALLAVGCGRKRAAQGAALPPGTTVLALGDSITAGTGADAAAAYPAQLAALTGWQVVNGGVPGDTAAQALERLPALLSEHQPKLVILSIGGNDLLRRLPVEAAEAAIRRSVALAREAGAQVLLVGVPQPSLLAAAGAALSDHPMYERIAADLKLPLHGGGWARVLGDAALKADQIHPNARGYRAFAEALATDLRAHGLLD